MTARLERTTFSVSRAADFLDVRALESQTGQPRHRFGDVVVKELLDNALDACETAGVPPEISVTTEMTGDVQLVTVADNAAGIPAGVVSRILDYSTLTSDKALYRSPCRGAQGNALKTIAGIPHALGVTGPVVIEAQGVRHEITVSLDMAGELQVSHEQAEAPQAAGTVVTVPLPASLETDAARWAGSYALVNPHATLTFLPNLGCGGADVYKAAVQGFRKPLPTDPTSAHWYDTAAFTRLIGSLAARGDDRPLGGFIREFAGLSATAKAKRIAARVPDVARVSDAQDPDSVRALLGHMQAESSAPGPAALGQVPKDHYDDMLEVFYGVDRSWFRRAGIVHDGIAWQIEVTVADTNAAPGSVIFASNYGVTFGDPLGATDLETSEIWATGARSFLSQLDAVPDGSNGHYRAAVVHVTCAAPAFLDKGKVSLDVPDEVAEVFARALWLAGRELYQEAEAGRRDWEREERREQAARRRQEEAARKADRMAAAAGQRRARADRQAERARRLTVREAVLRVIPEAIRQARDGSDLPFSAHSLFYKIRPLALRLLPAGTKIKSKYVEQQLIPEHEREHGRIAGMYRDPRGTLHEPHTGKEVPLGTREVRAYVPPEWTYNKILVVEKAGLWPVIQAAKIAERYDMAVITSEGYGAEACRELLAGMPAGDVQIFALHDADIDGYNIGRTLGEATARMPGHSVKITDLGLTVDIAIDHGLEPEEFTRKRAIPETILPRLSPVALEWFTGEVIERDNHGEPKTWLGRRVELNAFSSRDLITYIEAGLAAHGAAGKVVPPRRVLRQEASDDLDALVAGRVEEIVAELTDTTSITRDVRRIVRRRNRARLSPGAVRARFAEQPERSWRQVAAGSAAGKLSGSRVDFDRLVRQALIDRLSEMDRAGCPVLTGDERKDA